jgi:hypothetical protein
MLGLLASWTSQASAQWSSSSNINTPIATKGHDEGASRLLPDGSGGAFVAWTEIPAVDFGIRIQRVNAQGVKQWANDGIQVVPLPGQRFATHLVSDGAGGFVLVWVDDRNAPGVSFDIYAQRYSATGTPLWTPNGVLVTGAPGNQFSTVAVEAGSGSVIIAWDDERAAGGITDVYAQRLDASGATQWAVNGVALCTAAGHQRNSVGATDGAGGAIIAWEDERGASKDIFAQRVNASGVPQWALNGVVVVDETGEQRNVRIADDAAGGVFVAWTDYRFGGTSRLFVHHMTGAGLDAWPADGMQFAPDLSAGDPTHMIPDGAGGVIVGWDDYRGPNPDAYVQRIDASGAPLWAVDGLLVGGAAFEQYQTKLLSDGLGGAFVTWEDYRLGSFSVSNIYGQHVSGVGTMLWPASGTPIATAARQQYSVWMVSDGRGGMLLSWSDQRGAVGPDVYIQRVEQFGYLGEPEPRIQSVTDVAGDQGGKVRVAWNASYLDVVPSGPADEYRVWREVSVASALRAIERSGRWLEPGAALPADATGHTRLFRRSSLGTSAFYWELEGVQTANGFSAYSKVANTGGVSTPPTLHYTRYMVEARDGDTGYHWDSLPDSGYSVDDLPPPAPNPFNGSYSGGSSSLSWGPSNAPDVSFYRLYRGTDSGFTPSPGNRIASTNNTMAMDNAGAPYWYKVSAVDIHGNEGPAATTLPSGTVDVGSDLPAVLWLGPPSPNPFEGSASFRFTLPAASRVTLDLFDQQGRRVRTLVNRQFAAGRYEIHWDGLGEGGRSLGSGVYLYRIIAAGAERTGTVVSIR